MLDEEREARADAEARVEEKIDAERAKIGREETEKARLDESVKTHEARTGWIAVDLDGTLAFYDRWRGAAHVGAPIPLMVERVKGWLAAGREVKIFTARVASCYADAEENRAAIRLWCAQQFGRELLVTAEKDGRMAELWDDRAVGLVMNTGEIAVPPVEEPAAHRERIAKEALDRLAGDRKE